VKAIHVVLLGALGFAIAFGSWHLYLDHSNLHAIVNMVAASQNQQARMMQGQPPAAAPAPQETPATKPAK
jgi:hypothetical protein